MEAYPENEAVPVANRPQTIQGVTLAFLGLAWVAASLRLYVRCKSALWGWDDLFVGLAAVVAAAGAVFLCLLPGDGLGKHLWTLSESSWTSYAKHIYFVNVMYISSTSLIKMAILMQYLRLFASQTQQRVARIFARCLLGTTATWGLTFTCLALFSCNPVAKNWNAALPGKCVAWGTDDPEEFYTAWMAHAISNMVLDVLIFMCPIPFIRSLRMSGKTKLGLATLFCMGGTVVTISVVRVITLSIRRAGTIPILDMTWVVPNVFIFSFLEVNIGILAASAPIFWPLVSTLALNRILVVNEIDIRSESRTDLAARRLENGKSGFARLGAASDGDGHGHGHHRQHSGSGSRDKDADGDIPLKHRPSKTSFSSASQHGDVTTVLDEDVTRAQYRDKYEQAWAVPDFDKPVAGPNDRVTYTTTVERAEVPYDHIRVLDS
ncbi:hypothetical protein BDV95DRAFT_216366 [Massariosphaeria phaeospora]|uniref:Rhodopsin domain-containing protein n=1 Tax=Massariosphaeria phaeospora TaxID=100035 RepID=A0A7C8IJU6_9PLEO|nr:hypothetical protein BDV95DRAFT_216366 [Massariosphaeria phaeospora]